jgi:hypothetical protein
MSNFYNNPIFNFFNDKIEVLKKELEVYNIEFIVTDRIYVRKNTIQLDLSKTYSFIRNGYIELYHNIDSYSECDSIFVKLFPNKTVGIHDINEPIDIYINDNIRKYIKRRLYKVTIYINAEKCHIYDVEHDDMISFIEGHFPMSNKYRILNIKDIKYVRARKEISVYRFMINVEYDYISSFKTVLKGIRMERRVVMVLYQVLN